MGHPQGPWEAVMLRSFMQNIKGLGTSLGRESIDIRTILRDGMMTQAPLPVQPPHFTDAYTEGPRELMPVRQESGLGPLSSVLCRICVDSPASCHPGLSHSVQFSRSVLSYSFRPHGPQHARPPCPSPTPGVHPNPRPLSW